MILLIPLTYILSNKAITKTAKDNKVNPHLIFVLPSIPPFFVLLIEADKRNNEIIPKIPTMTL